MNRREFIQLGARTSVAAALGGAFASSCSFLAGGKNRPNIVLIYADDLGYGDLSCYGATRIQTPAIDRMAAEGVRFTEAHSTSATCTPARYSLLTGEYAWRHQGTGIAPGDAPLIVPENKPTLPAMLKKAGYATAAIGKWHLGLGKERPDWNGTLKPGPMELGFDEAFIMPATGDRVPCVYVENDHVYNLDPQDPITVSYRQPIGDDPTGIDHPEMLKVGTDRSHGGTIVNGVSRIGYMSGGRAARWVDEEMAEVFTSRAVAFMESRSSQPFFLYFALHDIHVPRVPHPRFAGRSPMGARGDAILQADWCVGQVLAALERLGLAENTLVIFSSDNGPVLDDGYADQAVELAGEHSMTGPLRGGKYSSYEGGTRIPLVLRWPRAVRPGTSAALFSQVDFYASFAILAGEVLTPSEAPDSRPLLEVLTGKRGTGRSFLVQEAIGQKLSVRTPEWKYIPPAAGEKFIANGGIETGRDANPQLYDLMRDPGERRNLADQHPEILQQMEELLAQVRRSGDRHLTQLQR